MIEDEGALARIHELDPARWGITSFPTYEFTGDPAFLEYIDPKKKGAHPCRSTDWRTRLVLPSSEGPFAPGRTHRPHRPRRHRRLPRRRQRHPQGRRTDPRQTRVGRSRGRDPRPGSARALGAGSTSLPRETWKTVAGLFSPRQSWQSAKPPEPFDTLAEAELNAHLVSSLMERVRHFIAANAAAAPEIAQLANVEKRTLYPRYLLEWANNFVSLSALYDSKVLTLFEEGAIVIDGRRLEFAMRGLSTAPATRRSPRKAVSSSCTRRFSEVDGKTLFEVAAPVTRGLKGRLVAGKRGVFLDRDGRVLDAQILEVVEHPIGIPDAIRAPFERTTRFISQRVEEFTASRQSAPEASMQASVVQAGTAAATAPTAAGAAPKGRMEPSQMADIRAGGGLAIAAVGSLLAFIVSSLAKITLIDALKVVLSIVGLVIVISAFVGWLKLRLRDLGPFLEAAGFATNPKMKVNGRLSRIFNRRPGLIRDHAKDRKPSGLIVIDDEDDATFEKWLTITLITILAFVVVVAGMAWYQGLSVVEVSRGLGGSGGS